jgi:hypothetical protein
MRFIEALGLRGKDIAEYVLDAKILGIEMVVLEQAREANPVACCLELVSAAGANVSFSG